MRLSPRLLKIVGLIPANSVVADIGTDHALLPVYLVVTGRCPRVIATDVRPGPLEAARRTVEEFSASDAIELRLGHGLSVIEPREADVIVIAGMGGRAMTHILERSPEVALAARRLILQPMSGAALVRRWLISRGFRIAQEELAAEGGHIYEVIAAEPGAEPSPDPVVAAAEMEVGPRLWEEAHPLLGRLIAQKCERLRAIIRQMEASGLSRDEAFLSRQERLHLLEELLHRFTEREDSRQ